MHRMRINYDNVIIGIEVGKMKMNYKNKTNKDSLRI